ncbi:MAG: PASTA domain-containing protein, partial [Oscillospiraceae bacterium]|nr:PASTA domain-containing protein [Oscillospiraceae bacterium]
SISFEYDVAELQTAADEGPEEPTRSLPGGAKGKGLKLDAKTEAEERKRIRKEMLEEENHKTRKSGNLLATLSAVLGVFVLIAILGFVIINMVDGLFNSPDAEMIEVPNFRGKAYTLELADEHPLLRLRVDREYCDDHAEGLICEQDPLPQRPVAIGTEIWLTVSLGREPVALIDMANMDLRAAQLWLIDNGLRYDPNAQKTANHDTIPRNFVISSEPGPNDRVFKGDLVVLTVSLGKDIINVTMPSLLGETEQAARSALQQYNLLIGQVRIVPSDNDAGTVVWQSVSAGEVVPENTEIDLDISEGPPDIIDPSPSDPDSSPSPPSPEVSPSESPPEETSPPPQQELVTIQQAIGIPQDHVGTMLLTVHRNGVKIFEETVSADTISITVPITGYPDDIIDVYFDGTLLYTRSIAALQQQQ